MKKSTWKVLGTLGLACLLSVAFICIASAEGSRDYTDNDGYRAYLEWNSTEIAGITRQTTLQVYANEGETIYFGSSVMGSFDGKDVVVIPPSGSEVVYDVQTGYGYINTLSKERIGPKVGTPETSAGFDPISFTVTETGIWQFQFHAPLAVGSSNPPMMKTGQQFPKTTLQYATVAAWDISVYSADGTYIPGRVFTNYLSMNIGANKTGDVLKSVFYVLTKDGYLYETDMNGLDSFGFMFFANNRGLVDNTNGRTLYHHAVCAPGGTALDSRYNLSLVDPSVPDTDYSITHRIFFNEPASDLPESIPTQPIAPATADNMRYTQNAEGNGGTFTFNASAVNTFEIQLQFGGDYADVMLGNPGIQGENTIVWDGKDGNGNLVEAGTYTASLTTKSGEYHFTLLDAENNPSGTKITLLNQPYSVEGYSPDVLYYNVDGYTVGNGQTVQQRAAGIPNPVDASQNGISSADGALKYSSRWGDEYAVDMWTYFPGTEIAFNFEVKDISTPVTPPVTPPPIDVRFNDCRFAYIFGYEPVILDGELIELRFAPEDNATREQVSAMIVRALAQGSDTLGDFAMPGSLPRFCDADPGRWSYYALSYLDSIGAFEGESELSAAADITRGEVAKLITIGLGISGGSKTGFTDTVGNKYETYIDAICGAGYMQGDGDGNFRPDVSMTRAEFCTMFNKIFSRNEANGYYLRDKEGNQVDHTTYYFTDMDDKTDAWYYNEMIYATSAFLDDGYVDVDTRMANIRNVLDRYNGQKLY